MEETMNGFCPSCEKESELTRVRKTEDIIIKGESIPAEMDYFVCNECGNEFDNPDPEYDPLAVAYQEYRRRKGMVQPQEIRSFREKYGLTQRELSDLLGFGGATLSRYENGSLQDETHDTLLRLIMQPQNLLKIIQEKTGALPSEKSQQVVVRLTEEIRRSELLNFLRGRSHYRQASILNGNREINIDRLLNVIKRLCFHTTVYKTKLNKLLFYADFLNFREYGQSITGLCYAHLPYGPVPDQYELIYERLVELDPRLVKEEDQSLDCPADTFRCDDAPETGILSFQEEQILFRVLERFRSFNARDIMRYSHQEEGYQMTQNSEIISYEYARTLNA
jgi:putative zinc finger/helix-turn-helix YgiT family protein